MTIVAGVRTVSAWFEPLTLGGKTISGVLGPDVWSSTVTEWSRTWPVDIDDTAAGGITRARASCMLPLVLVVVASAGGV